MLPRLGGMRAAAVVAAAVLIVIGALSASIGTREVAAVTDLDQDQEVIDDFECFQRSEATACYNGLAQTFTVGMTGQLTGIELPLSQSPYWTTSETLTIELRDGSPDGAVLATSVAADHEVQQLPVEPDYAWVAFSFGLSPLNVTAGEVLAITFPNSPLEPPQESYLGWGKAATDVYAGGVAWGGSSSGWSDWENGSDFAFATYVTTSAPICDLVAGIGEEEPTDGPLTVEVGLEVIAYLIDFPPSADVNIAVVPEGSAVTGDVFTTDVYGELAVSVTFVEGAEGNWRISAQALGVEDCGDIVEITVVAAAAPTVSPSAAPTASPSAAPTLSASPAPTAATAPVATATPAQQLPDTAAGAVQRSPVLPAALALIAGVGVLASVRTRRLRR